MPISTRRRTTGSELADYAQITRALAATRRDLVPERWHQGAPAIDAHGRETEPDAPESVAWCVQGILLDHLRHGTNTTIRAAMHLLHRTASRLSEGRHDTLFAFNDAPTTTFADIDRLLGTAISEAEALAAKARADGTVGGSAATTLGTGPAGPAAPPPGCHRQPGDCHGRPVPTE